MKLDEGRVYFKKEIQRMLGSNDMIWTVNQDGNHLSNIWLRLNDDDEMLLKDVQDTVGIGMYAGAKEYKCKIYVVEVPTEIIKRIREAHASRVK